MTLTGLHAAGSDRPVGAEVTADLRLRLAHMGAHPSAALTTLSGQYT